MFWRSMECQRSTRQHGDPLVSGCQDGSSARPPHNSDVRADCHVSDFAYQIEDCSPNESREEDEQLDHSGNMQSSPSKLADAPHDSESSILKNSAFDQQNTHENTGASGDQMDTEGASSCQQKDSWEAYIRWLSTAEFGEDDDASQSDSEEKDAYEGDAAAHSKLDKLPVRDEESSDNLTAGKGAGAAARDGDAVRKRKSRWEPLPEHNGDRPHTQKKRSRWSPEKPPSVQSHFRDVKKLSLYMDPEFLDLKIKLGEINKKLRTGQVLDDNKPSRFRSPSPDPVYDNFGNRVNSRENRAREKLNKERQLILDRLAKKGPSLQTSVKRKLSTKVYIPPPQYPEYNPIALVLGPQGLTQQRVEKETGAKLYIRGKATGNVVSPFAQPCGDERLHVRIEAESEISLHKAASMVRNLLFPVGGGHSELKLWELASVNGNSRANEMCNYCKQLGHYKNECPLKTRSAASNTHSFTYPNAGILEQGNGNSRANEMCNYCKQLGHYKNECPVKTRSSAAKTHSHTHPNSGMLEQGNKAHELKAYSNNALASGLLGFKGGMSGGELGPPAVQNPPQVGVDLSLKEDYNDIEVSIGNLPLSINDAGLLRLFLPFGQVTHAKVISDQGSGLSMGYGVVRFLKAADAWQAVSVLNGFRLDDKVLLVKTKVPLQVAANGSLLPSVFQQESREEVAVSSAFQAYVPHAGMPPSRAAQVSAPSIALQGMGPCGDPLATGGGLETHETHVGASSFLPPNHLVQQSQKQPSPSRATQAGFSGSYLHYDYTPFQTKPFSSSATQGGVTGLYPLSSYDYAPSLKQPVFSSATEAVPSGLYHSSNVNIVQSPKQVVPNSASEAGLDQQQSQRHLTPSIAPHASSAFPPPGFPTRNGTTLPPPHSFTLAANFFGQFMMAAAAAAAAASSSSRSPRNPDQQQLHKHSAMAGAITGSRAAPPIVSNGAARPPFNSFTGASNLFGGLPPPGSMQGRPRGHYSEQGGTTYHTHHGSRDQ